MKKVLPFLIVGVVLLCMLFGGVLFLGRNKIKDFLDDRGVSLKRGDSEYTTTAQKEQGLKEFAEQGYDSSFSNVKMVGNFEMTGLSEQITFEITVDGDNSMIVMKFPTGDIYWNVYEGKTYMTNDPDKEWYYFSDATEEDTSSPFSSEEIDDMVDIEKINSGTAVEGEDYTYLGLVDCGDLKCHKYEIKDPSADKVVIFFDNKDKKLRRMELESDTQGTGYFDFEYDNVSVAKPENVVTLEGDEAFTKMFEIFAPLFGGFDVSDFDASMYEDLSEEALNEVIQ